MFRNYELLCMLGEHGREVTLRVNSTSGAYDPATGTISGGATTDYTVMAYPSDYNLMERQASQIVDGMRKVVLSTIDTNGNDIPSPEVDDQIIGIGDTVNVTRVQTIYSSTAVCYICHVRE